MIRARFKANPEDYRPVKFPPPYPFWCSGYPEDHSIVVAYADSEKQILEFWPEATDIEATEEDEIIFSERFPKPDWWKPYNALAASEGEMKIFPKRCFYSNPGGNAAWDFLEPPKYSQSYNIKIIPYISLEEHEAILAEAAAREAGLRVELEKERDWGRLVKDWKDWERYIKFRGTSVTMTVENEYAKRKGEK